MRLNQIKCLFIIITLYDKIESYLRALESLGITTDKCASMLVPMVESSLLEELLRAWQRSGMMQQEESNTTAQDRLTKLIKFIESEVQNELRITMAMSGFDLKAPDCEKSKRKAQESSSKNVPSAASLIVTKKNCIFCSSKEHYSDSCKKAQAMDRDEIQDIVKRSRACFRCMRMGHASRGCPVKYTCKKCGRQHTELMCLPPSERRSETTGADARTIDSDKSGSKPELNYACMNSTPEVFMQTLKVFIKNDNCEIPVRVVLDPGSQHSYVLKRAVQSLKYEPIGELSMNHNVFGGEQFGLKHKQYRVRLENLKKAFSYNFSVLDQELICSEVPTVQKGVW